MFVFTCAISSSVFLWLQDVAESLRLHVKHVKLSCRLFVLPRMSCLRGQSRHETRKGDVEPLHFCVGLQTNEEQIPVDTTDSLKQSDSHHVMRGTGSPEDLHRTNRTQENCKTVVIFWGKSKLRQRVHQNISLSTSY